MRYIRDGVWVAADYEPHDNGMSPVLRLVYLADAIAGFQMAMVWSFARALAWLGRLRGLRRRVYGALDRAALREHAMSDFEARVLVVPWVRKVGLPTNGSTYHLVPSDGKIALCGMLPRYWTVDIGGADTCTSCRAKVMAAIDSKGELTHGDDTEEREKA